jgi:hypothetical protein
MIYIANVSMSHHLYWLSGKSGLKPKRSFTFGVNVKKPILMHAISLYFVYPVFKSSVSQLSGLTLSELQNIPRLALPPLSANATGLFHTSSAELDEVAKSQAAIAPQHVLREDSLNGTDAINLGFRPFDVFNATRSG